MAAENVQSVFVVVTDTYINPARTGIQTLVRGLIAGLLRSKARFHLVEWRPDKQELIRLRPKINAALGRPGERKFFPITVLLQPGNWPLVRQARARNYRIPIHLHPAHRDHITNSWLLIPELMYSGDARAVIDYARQCDLRVAAIFHDAIPVSHPHFVGPSAVGGHADYMRALTRADKVLAVSRESADAFIQFAMANDAPHRHVTVCSEPAEILGIKRVTHGQISESDAINLLCVSTLEPRKNHLTLIDAFEDFLKAHPNVNAFLHLIGDSYEAAPEIARSVTEAAGRNQRILWHGKLSQAELVNKYRSIDFTVYPSVIEGFGLPVAESLWMGKPCICANFGAVTETAGGGGCLMVDVRDRHVLSDAIAAMCTRPELRRTLTQQAVARPLKSWRDYAVEIRRLLAAPAGERVPNPTRKA